MGDAYPIAPDGASDRRNLIYLTARTVVLLGHRFLVRPHIEMDGELAELKRRGDAVFLYCGLHKSLWETTGVLAPLHLAGLPVPYVGMGDNLVHGRLFRRLSWQMGAFFVRRPTSRKEVLESARKLRDDVLSLLAHGRDVMVFPEGTRKNIPAHAHYGDFFPTAFDAALEYQRHQQRILESNPGLERHEAYVVPFNVDYTRVREAEEMVADHSGHPRTLHVLDSFSMIRSIGDAYLSYGRPIRVADHLDADRKALAALARARCLDLVKILPVNVASRAMLQFEPGAAVPPSALDDAMRRVLEALHPYADRFRGFGPDDGWTELVRRAAQVRLDFRRLEPENVRLYRLYASYIAHYLDPPRAAAA